MTPGATDWNPGAYDRFRGLRLRPALDLLAQVPALPAGVLVDLGCGSGSVGPALRQQYPQARLIGLDASPAMLEAARGTGAYDALAAADIGDWRPDEPPALIFSNAALQWLDDHPRLIPRLAGLLAPGGVLAVQVPRNFDAPSHRLLREIAARDFPGRHPEGLFVSPVAPVVDYMAMLAPSGMVEGWETEYVQRLAPVPDDGHPVRRFTESAMMRPFLAPLDAEEAIAFTRTYDAALAQAYPRQADGSVLFAMRRVFFVLVRR